MTITLKATFANLHFTQAQLLAKRLEASLQEELVGMGHGSYNYPKNDDVSPHPIGVTVKVERDLIDNLDRDLPAAGDCR